MNDHTEPLTLRRPPPAGQRGVTGPAVRSLFAGVAVLTVVIAAALPALTVRTGYFVDSEVPVHSEPVDGWGCHLLGACQDPHAPSGAVSPQLLRGVAGQGVRVDCALGGFYKLSRPVTGWAPQHAVRTSADPIGCYATEF